MNAELQLLRPSDVAPLLGVSTSRVYQMLAAGAIPHVRVAGVIRIPRAAWSTWIQSQADRALERVRADGREGS